MLLSHFNYVIGLCLAAAYLTLNTPDLDPTSIEAKPACDGSATTHIPFMGKSDFEMLLCS